LEVSVVPKSKDTIQEFADIAKTLPENLQVVCFELLLSHHLECLVPRTPAPGAKSAPPEKPAATEPSEPKTVGGSAEGQEDLATKDLHLKARRFLEKYSLSIDSLNNLFYKEGDQILPLYEDLKTTRMSEGQMRVTLLQALRNAIDTGDFEAEVKQVRTECTDRKCNDKPNFAANFKNHKDFFDFDEYTKTTKTVKLSEQGCSTLST